MTKAKRKFLPKGTARDNLVYEIITKRLELREYFGVQDIAVHLVSHECHLQFSMEELSSTLARLTRVLELIYEEGYSPL